MDGTPAQTPKAVFIIVDGIPADVIETVATPNLDKISGDSGYTRAYVGGAVGGASESPTISAVGYNSLLTGTWANKHNVWDNDVSDPNYDYWDIFRIAKSHDPSLQTAIFSTWTDNRTKLIGDGLPSAGGNKLDYHFDGFELDTKRFPHDENGNYIRNIDAIVAEEAARRIEESGPDLSWIYLENTDHIGHRYGDSPEQIEAVKLMDEQLGAIWASVTSRQVKHDEDWLVVVTTDHGRDAETGKGHGGQSDRERTTWIVTNSERLNENFDHMPAIVDILLSVATHLGLRMPETVRDQLDGHSFID
jgi:predicted AlkP superfamily pyrophosphatase or phosphodiesterase